MPKKPPKCEGTIPEHTISRETQRDVEVTVETEDGPRTKRQTIIEKLPEVVPARPCDAEATMLARSMREARCNLGGAHWVRDGDDHAYCPRHFEPGTMTHLDGRATQHAPMAIEDA